MEILIAGTHKKTKKQKKEKKKLWKKPEKTK